MRGLRALRAQSPAIVISLLALVFSLGGGAYAATALSGRPVESGSLLASRDLAHGAGHAQPQARVSFHALRLLNGWKASGLTGSPRYAVRGGIVYLAGGVFQPVAGIDTFARLPRGARPAHNLFFTVSVDEGQDTIGTLFISPAGKMVVYSFNASDARAVSAFSGVSFPLGS